MKKRMTRWTAALSALIMILSVAGCKKKESKPGEQPEPSGSGTSQSEPGAVNSESSAVGYNSAAYWLGKLSNPDGIVMDANAVAQYNASLTADAANTKCVDLSSMPGELSRQELNAMLDEIAVPQDERYIGASKATPDYYKKLTENLNKAGVKDRNEAGYGFAVQNTILRTFPTADPSYEFPNDAEFDLFAETMLKTWEPVRVLHASADGKWLFVQSRSYRAWAPAGNIAVCAQTEWSRYAEPQNPLVVTGNRVTLNQNVYNDSASGRELFMGTVLPMVEDAQIPATIDGMTSASGYAVLLPARGENGSLIASQALVPWNADVHPGYLAYTRGNVLRQAFKMLGDRHGWSGMNKSRDSTALIMDVFATFGLHLPRNSAQQAMLPGEETDLAGLSDSEKTAKILEIPAGSLLLMNGHVALYVGAGDDDAPYVLHSIYVAYDDGGNEQIYNAIVVSDLSLHERSGETYLSALRSAREIR